MSQPSRSSSLSSPAGPSSRATPSLDTTAAGTTPTTEWNLDGSPASLSFAANSTSTGSLSPFIHNRTFAAHTTLNSTLGITTQAASSPIQRQRGMSSQQNGNGNGNGTLGLGKKPTVDTEPPSPSPLTAPSHSSAPSPSPSPSPSHHPLLKNLSTGSLSSKSDSSTTSDHASATGSGQTGLANGRGRLLIVANRLPLSMKRSGENKEISFTPSSGGLVSALKGVKGTQMQWIGWPGAEVSSKKDQEVVKSQLKQHNALPVFLSQETCDLFYNGFCNNILWPLFHYIPLPIESLQMADAQFSAYEQANLKFAKVVLDNYRDGDTVWVHDYHLMLLPAMLRQSQPHMKIGFFLHTPFPSSEIFRVLPSRKELLLGVLASDLIGFHTHDYARHFQSSCVRFVGAASTGDIIKAEGLNSHLGTFPIGIDPQSFLKALDTTQVHNFQKDLEQKFGGKKVLLGIDRLDYIKGIPHKLYAFERFFEQNPDWIGKCVLVQIAIPSRTDVPEYQKLRSQTHELVGRVNGKFGSLDSVPIHYLDQSIPFDKMCALYRVSDVMVISSVRDGMNLVAYEYIACQKDRAGVLILSEFAGAGQSLGAGALSVNPWSITDLADAIKTALTMPMSERRERNAYAFKHVLTHTAQHWAETFVNALHATSGPASPVCDNEPLSIPPPLNFETVVTAFQSSKHRLIVTGLAGTLTENQKPEESFKEFERHVKASAKMQAAIKLLSQDPNTTLLVLTSRSRLMCDSVLGDTEAWQAAENGYFLRKGGKDQPWLMMHENLDLSWKEGVHRVFEYFTDRTPRTYIKDQETHMSWHYADAEPTFAKRQANDMISHLTGGPLSNTSTEVLDSSNIIQVRPLGVSKGIAIKQILNELNTWGKQKAYAWAENDKNPEFHTYPVAPNYIEDEMEEKETYHSSSINNIKNTNLSVNSLTNSPKVRRCSSSVSLRDLSRGTSGQHAHSHAHHHHDSIWSTESDAHHGTHTNRLLSQKRSHKLPPVDFVLCIGNFLDRDEDLFAVLNERAGHAGSPALGRNSRTGSRMTTPTPSSHTIASPSPSPDDEITLPQSVKHKEPSPSTSITNSPHSPATSIVAPHATSTTSTKGAHIFTCSVGEKPSHAQFFVPSVAQVETLLTQLATTLPSQNNNRLGLTLPSSAASITPTIQSPTPAPIQAVIPTGAH